MVWGILLQLQKFSRVCNEVLQRVAAQQDDEESLKLSAALLEQNPECYTVWNYRRRAMQPVLQVGNGPPWRTVLLKYLEYAGKSFSAA